MVLVTTNNFSANKVGPGTGKGPASGGAYKSNYGTLVGNPTYPTNPGVHPNNRQNSIGVQPTIRPGLTQNPRQPTAARQPQMPRFVPTNARPTGAGRTPQVGGIGTNGLRPGGGSRPVMNGPRAGGMGSINLHTARSLTFGLGSGGLPYTPSMDTDSHPQPRPPTVGSHDHPGIVPSELIPPGPGAGVAVKRGERPVVPRFPAQEARPGSAARSP